jgi:phage shock protein C
MFMNRRLYRCRHDRRLAGVASGVAEFFYLDPTLVRVLWFLSVFFYGLGLLLYIGLAVIVPLEPATTEAGGAAEASGAAAEASGEAALAPEGHRHAPRGDGPWTTLFGFGLILFGTLALVHSYLPGAERFVVPAIMIGIGGFLVARSVRREPMGS